MELYKYTVLFCHLRCCVFDVFLLPLLYVYALLSLTRRLGNMQSCRRRIRRPAVVSHYRFLMFSGSFLTFWLYTCILVVQWRFQAEQLQ